MDVHEFSTTRTLDGEACLSEALFYLSLGWSVLSLCPPDHVGMRRASKNHGKDCDSPGKRPWHTWKEFQDRLPTEDEVRQWWKQVPNANVGLALGEVSGLVRIDVEGASGEAKLLEMSKGDLPKTLEFTSGRAEGGRGLLYKIPHGVKIATTYQKPQAGEEVRFQAKGAQTVLPPSRHPSGNVYTWKDGCSPYCIEAATMPAWLLAVMQEKANGKPAHSKNDWDAIFAGSPNGARHDSALAFIGKILGSMKDVENVGDLRAFFVAIEAWNERNDPPLPENDLRGMFTRLAQAEAAQRRKKDEDELNAFVQREVEASCEQSRGGEKNLPNHLVIVQSDPPQFRLRMFYWAESPRLKNGYLILSGKQILDWKAIKEACYMQAHIVIPPVMKDWSKPEGQLSQLTDAATYISATPESQIRLSILGFVCRYLANASPPIDVDGKKTMPLKGQPTKLEDGSFVFKLANMKKAVIDAKEEFKPQTVTGLLEEYGFGQTVIDNSRWWKASPDAFRAIGSETKEFE